MSEPEFSRPFDPDRLSRGAITLTISAKEDERAALAKRFDLLALPHLSAELTISSLPGGEIEVTGRLSAKVVQPCAITLAPVESDIEEELEGRFTFKNERRPAQEEFSMADLSEAEPIGPEGLDLGEWAAQSLALALPPYPRAPGAELPEELTGSKVSPFDALKLLKGKAKP